MCSSRICYKFALQLLGEGRSRNICFSKSRGKALPWSGILCIVEALPWPGPFWRLCALSRTIAETPNFGLKCNTKEDPLPRPGPFQGFPALMEALV